MQIQLKNVGKINSAELEIDSITIIAGDNNTGKSTIGKSVYAFFQGTKDVEEENFNEQYSRLQMELNRLRTTFMHRKGDFERQLFSEMLNEIEEFSEEKSFEKLAVLFKDLKEKIQLHYTDENIESSGLYEVDRLLKIIEVDVTSTEYKEHFLEQVFKDEFANSINSVDTKETPSVLTFKSGKDHFNEITFNDNQLMRDKTSIEHFNNLGAIYIDNPFILDEPLQGTIRRLGYRIYSWDHSAQLGRLLSSVWRKMTVFDEFVMLDRFDNIFSEVVEGDLRIKGREIHFEESKTGSIYPVRNLATGMKSFSLLKTLIKSAALSSTDILILDEPEVHLHPKWQLKYAELIVLLSIEFNLKVLVASHSPYFVEAIELYSQKHKISKRINYYQSIMQEEGAILKDVTNDLPSLYADFATPFIELEKLRDAYDEVD